MIKNYIVGAQVCISQIQNALSQSVYSQDLLVDM